MSESSARITLLLSLLSAAVVTIASKKVTSSGFKTDAAVVFLATDTRVLSLNTTSGAQTVLTQSEAEYIYQRTIPADSNPSRDTTQAIWVLLRPRSSATNDSIVRVSLTAGRDLETVQLPFSGAKDVLRIGNKVFLLSSEDGSIIDLDLPDMDTSRQLSGFLFPKERPTAIARAEGGQFWVLTQNQNVSSLVRIDLLGRLLQRVEDIGTGVTDLAQWRDLWVVLGPDAVGLVNIMNGAVDHEIYTLDVGDASLKGLTVVGDTAIFGINHLPPHDASRQQQQDAEVAVLNLTTHELISRTKVRSTGSVNSIASPEAWKGTGASNIVPHAEMVGARQCAGQRPYACALDGHCRLRRVQPDLLKPPSVIDAGSIVCDVCKSVPCYAYNKNLLDWLSRL